MPDRPRLPTSVFGFLAVVVLSLGGGWWVNAAPPAPPPAPAADTVTPPPAAVVTPGADGSRRTYIGRRTMRSWQHRAAATAAYSTTTWPCRISRDAAAPIEPAAGAALAHGLRCARRD